MGYINLHHHTTYSLLEAIGSVKEHVSRTSELGMDAIAITDYNAMYGAMDLYKSVKGTGIKPILGVDMPWVRQLTKNDPMHWGYITFLAKDIEGYHTLLRLVSAAAMRRDSGAIPFVDMDLLREDHKGVMAFWGGVESWYGQAILRNDDVTSIQDEGGVIVDLLGQDNVFAEMIAQDYSILSDTRRVNDALMSAAKGRGIDQFVSNNVRYVDHDHREAFEVALAIKDNKRMYDDSRRKIVSENHIVDGSWIMQVMTKNGYDSSTVQNWITQTQLIADKVDIVIDMGETLFPHYQSPERMKKMYERESSSLVVE